MTSARDRIGITDPKSVYHGRNDLLEQARTNFPVTAACAGIDPNDRPSPGDIPQTTHDRAFAHQPAPALTQLVAGRIEALAAQGAEAVERAVARLRDWRRTMTGWWPRLGPRSRPAKTPGAPSSPFAMSSK
jgi:hypothetical protein